MSDYVDTVDIEGVQYDIQDTATKTTADQNKQDIEAMKESADYSTEEHLTGRKWINNKPTYEKTVNFGALPNATTQSYSIPISSIETIVKLTGFATNVVSGVTLPLPFAHIIPENNIGIYASRTTLDIFTGTSWGGMNATYITIEYTKTTDSPQP